MALLKALQILVLEEEAKNPGKVLDQDFIAKKQQVLKHWLKN
jgi:hypothetical protein